MNEEKINTENTMAPDGFDWSAKADPNVAAGNYFQGTVSGELSDEFGQEVVTTRLVAAFRSESVKNQSNAINAIPHVLADLIGESPEFSRRDMLLIFAGFKMGEVSRAATRSYSHLEALLRGVFI